jgi:cephalosporin hydroxylase
MKHQDPSSLLGDHAVPSNQSQTDYFNFCPRLKEIIETGQSIDSQGSAISINGVFSTLNNLHIIRELLIREKISNTLEIGLAYGGSALTFLATLKTVSPHNFHHSAIDPFQTRDWGGSSLRVLSEEGYSSHFTHYEELSALVLPDLVKQKKEYGLIYIDGYHLFENVFIDFYYSSMLLPVGGYMLFDDCTDPHVNKVIQFIKKNYQEILVEIDYRSIENPNKSLKKKIANKLGIRQLQGFRKISDPPRQWNVKYSMF